jgi:hypothetical protein
MTRRRRRQTEIKDLSHFKPKKFRHYYTLAEVAEAVKRHKSRIIKLEAEGKIPVASRVQAGEISIRLWSPEQVDEIKWLLRTTIRPGRPPNDS